jgi:hypothetical protein
LDERLGGKKTLRAKFKEESVRLNCSDDAARTAPGFQDAHWNPGLLQAIRASQSGNSSAHYKYGIHILRRIGQEKTSIGRSKRF